MTDNPTLHRVLLGVLDDESAQEQILLADVRRASDAAMARSGASPSGASWAEWQRRRVHVVQVTPSGRSIMSAGYRTYDSVAGALAVLSERGLRPCTDEERERARFAAGGSAYGPTWLDEPRWFGLGFALMEVDPGRLALIRMDDGSRWGSGAPCTLIAEANGDGGHPADVPGPVIVVRLALDGQEVLRLTFATLDDALRSLGGTP